MQLGSRLLWLWCRLAAVAPIQPLAWKPPYAMGVALKSREKKKSWPSVNQEAGSHQMLNLTRLDLGLTSLQSWLLFFFLIFIFLFF